MDIVLDDYLDDYRQSAVLASNAFCLFRIIPKYNICISGFNFEVPVDLSHLRFDNFTIASQTFIKSGEKWPWPSVKNLFSGRVMIILAGEVMQLGVRSLSPSSLRIDMSLVGKVLNPGQMAPGMKS